MQILLADGLGHGPLAADAANRAKRVFGETRGGPLILMEAMHRALQSTRGAAVAVAEIDPAGRSVRYCGVGNIAGVIASANDSQHMVSMNGIVGHQAMRTREFTYRWDQNSLIVMHSDGISGRWQLSGYPGLAGRRASVIAAVLFRDLRKTSDDATVLVGRQR